MPLFQSSRHEKERSWADEGLQAMESPLIDSLEPGSTGNSRRLRRATLEVAADDTVETSHTSIPAEPPKIVLWTAAFVSFLVNVIYSIPATFLPLVLEKQGISQEMVGVVFGIEPLVTVFASPFCGYISARIGGKKILLAGMTSVSVTTAIFGFFPHSYWAMFCVRACLGVGQACINVGVNSIVAHYYGDGDIGMAMGLIEIGTSIGIIAGPPIGGALYELTYFFVPFVASGLVMLMGVPVVIWAFPSVYVPHEGIKPFSVRAMLSAVNITMAWTTVIGTTAFSFLDPTLSLHISKYHKLGEDRAAGIVGMLFFMCAFAYGTSSVIAGKITDRGIRWAYGSILAGTVVMGTGFCLLGPFPIKVFAIPESMMWARWIQTCIGLCCLSTGGALSTIPTLPVMTKFSKTYGSIGIATATGLWSAALALGEVLGPVGGGLMVGRIDHMAGNKIYGDGFAWSAACLALCQACSFLMTSALVTWKCMCVGWTDAEIADTDTDEDDGHRPTKALSQIPEDPSI